jgi:hypothetical protein
MFSLTAILFIKSNIRYKQRQRLALKSQQQQPDDSEDGFAAFIHQEKELDQEQRNHDYLLKMEQEKMIKERSAMNREPLRVKGTTVTPGTAVVDEHSKPATLSKSDLQKGKRRLQSVYYDQFLGNLEKKENNGVRTFPANENDLSKQKLCRYTVSGHDLVTDSRGYTCTLSQLNTKTMCCMQSNPVGSTSKQSEITRKQNANLQEKETRESSSFEIKRYSCDSCNPDYQCCETYEYCVSCCLRPEMLSQVEKLYAKYQKEKKLLYTNTQTVFQFCATRCRTNSNSVMNENRYRTKLKHCYGSKDPADIFTNDLGA